MSKSQKVKAVVSPSDSKLSQWWSDLQRACKILSAAGISNIMVLLSFVFLFRVDQVKDAVIALGNFGRLHHFVIFGFVGMLWAFLVWYWARVFFYIQFHNDKALKGWEKEIIEHTPHVLGAVSLLVISFSFLIQAPLCQLPGKANPIRILGLIFLALTVVFLIIVNFWKKLLPDELSDARVTSLQKHSAIVPIKDLRPVTRNILFITTIFAVILLVLLIIFPIHMTIYLGDGVTILIGCFCIWLPLFYWVRYSSLRSRLPVFLFLFILIAVFSLFNGNKNVRVTDQTSYTQTNLTTFYQNDWNTRDLKPVPSPDGRKPLIIVLSEGGGIRAAYWSAKFMARVQTENSRFRDYLFGISGVSGGSFGATIFDSLLKSNVSDLEGKTTDIVGKDYLSPVIACMFTREIVQFFIPFPISSFDHAKVFEDTWEFHWKDQLNGDPTFGDPFLSLWHDAKGSIPPLFINSTQVEDGYPVLASNLNINAKDDLSDTPDLDNTGKDFVIPKDFYNDIMADSNKSRDIRVSTASLLSARFPYIGPAGTIINKNGNTIGLVDGGYFDNSGANTAYQVLLSLKSWDEQQRKLSQPKLKSVTDAELDKASIYRSKIIPVVVYLQNGTETANQKTSGHTMFYQLFAPIVTMLQVRDAHTNNALFRVEEFVKLYDGEFIPYSLQEGINEPATIPLGWALSKTTQKEIDDRVKAIDISRLSKYLK